MLLALLHPLLAPRHPGLPAVYTGLSQLQSLLEKEQLPNGWWVPVSALPDSARLAMDAACGQVLQELAPRRMPPPCRAGCPPCRSKLTNTASVVKFIEDNWLGSERISGSFDASSGSLDGWGSLLDFSTRPHFQPLILNPATGAVVSGA